MKLEREKEIREDAGRPALWADGGETLKEDLQEALREIDKLREELRQFVHDDLDSE